MDWDFKAGLGITETVFSNEETGGAVHADAEIHVSTHAWGGVG